MTYFTQEFRGGSKHIKDGDNPHRKGFYGIKVDVTGREFFGYFNGKDWDVISFHKDHKFLGEGKTNKHKYIDFNIRRNMTVGEYVEFKKGNFTWWGIAK